MSTIFHHLRENLISDSYFESFVIKAGVSTDIAQLILRNSLPSMKTRLLVPLELYSKGVHSKVPIVSAQMCLLLSNS